MSLTRCPIAVIDGADAPQIQRVLADFAVRHRGDMRIAGVVEVFADAACKQSFLRSLAGGREFTLFQDLGEAADACALLPEGLVTAAYAVCQDIARGCDLVILSKFGKLEAENGSGLVPAFVAALEAGVPVLTSVSPRFTSVWSSFATPLYSQLECSSAAIDDWWIGLMTQVARTSPLLGSDHAHSHAVCDKLGQRISDATSAARRNPRTTLPE